jgi:putative flippase GtrA
MSRWRTESAILARYLGSGALNTLVGFGIIFLLMAVGVSPVLANICGYAVGFVLGFVVSRRFVFRSEGGIASEGLRYLLAFLSSFLANLLVLHIALGSLQLHPLLAQFLAACTYTGTMYLLTRFVVFRTHARH